MIIHLLFGRRRVEQREGVVADFCPICRAIRVFDFIRVAKVFHCFGIPLGHGTLINYFAKCRDCFFELPTNPDRYLNIFSKAADLEEVITKTYPNVRAAYSVRLALEETVRKHPSSLCKADREKLLLEPFQVINPTVEKHFSGQTPLDLQSSLGCLGTIVLTVGMFALAVHYIHSALGDHLLLATLFVGLFFTAVTLYQFYRRPFRYFRRHLIPLLVRALKPLNPSRDDLEQCLLRCREQSLLIEKHVVLKDLLEALQFAN